MTLDRYHRKRDFAATPEPSGTVGDPGGGRFVVQRHRATRLHYDVRLEMDGVLASWAVPKGPTLDADKRRMAVHVEDHPLDYFDFEGVIPAKQYGAGDVVVWDWGTYQPEETDDPAAAVRAGELKFSAAGEKLRGRFTLVRTSRAGDSWLLIHKRDSFAVPGWDAEDHPRSVKSGRTNDEVRDAVPAVWDGRTPAAEAAVDLSAAITASQPEFIPPMLATLADAPFSDDAWLFEVKWDGYRVEIVVRDGAAQLWTRNRKDAAAYFPDLARPASWISARDAIVDGEVVALDSSGRPDFSLLQAHAGTRGRGAEATVLVYEAFDLLHLDGRSLLEVPLEQRKRLLRSVLRPHPVVRYASHVVGEGDAFFAAARRQRVEGIVAKLRQSRYEPGRRSRAWLKIKLRQEQEVVVAGWLPGRGTHHDLGSLIVAVHEDGQLRHAGQVGSGLDAPARRDLLARLEPLRRDHSPLDPVPRLPQARWVAPQLVIRAEFAEWTADGLLRQAAFKGLEIGKAARSVVRERPVHTEAATTSAQAAAGRKQPSVAGRRPADGDDVRVALAALTELGAGGTLQIGEEEVRVTNLDKVLFPAADNHPALTKRDLLGYAMVIAPTLLPHLRDRALNLQRFPDGIASGRGFWQKDVPRHAPAWLARWSYTGHEGTKDYVVADRPATLVWLAQEAAIEIHPWTSRIDAAQRPTFALIDIDPGPTTSWDEVLVLARLYRTALAHLGTVGLPKVTGKRGIQVWVPIRPIYTFDQTRDWVEGISRAIGATVPDLVSWEWSKRDRSGRARLDFTQNALNKTLVAPYAVRPAAGAPVSAPIRWEELDDPQLRPDRWTIASIPPRVADIGDLFRPAVELEQELPRL